jgi:thiol-disulfide isomerase/thioredoxin
VLPLQYGTPVAGAPFCGVRTLDYEPAENSSDPTPVHGEEKVCRDSQGRRRSEIKYGDRLANVYIVDLVAKVRYQWAAGDTVVRSYPIPPPATTESSSAAAGDLADDAPVIEGVKTRYSRVVKGTDAAPEVVESWYSPELHMTMLTVIDAKGVGKTTYRFQHVVRTEPDAALFRVPAGFTMEDAKKAPPPAQTTTGPATAGSGDAKPAAPAAAYESDPKFQKALAEAKNGRMTEEERLDNWKHANKVAHGECVPCLQQIVVLQEKLGAYKDAVNTTVQLEAVATDARTKLSAKAERGRALMAYNYGQPKQEQVVQAEEAFRDVLAKSPNSRSIVFMEGRALAMLGRNDDAKAMFAHYVDLAPASDNLRMRAERFSDDPHLATLQMAPPFRMITAQGEELQLDDMGGKVVLLDFRATWCGPCKATLPEVARLAKDYANDPMLVVISVSQDANAATWKDFVQKNNMTWPQYRDANNALGAAYGVTAIPHFFTIDTNGVLKTEQVGSGTDVRGLVSDLVKKAHKAEARRAAETKASLN